MQIAQVHQPGAQLATHIVFEEHIVWYDDGRAAADFQRADHMLDEGKRSFGGAGGDDEIAARNPLGEFVERRIGQDQVNGIGVFGL